MHNEYFSAAERRLNLAVGFNPLSLPKLLHETDIEFVI